MTERGISVSMIPERAHLAKVAAEAVEVPAE
jgi:hypothetical protein